VCILLTAASRVQECSAAHGEVLVPPPRLSPRPSGALASEFAHPGKQEPCDKSSPVRCSGVGQSSIHSAADGRRASTRARPMVGPQSARSSPCTCALREKRWRHSSVASRGNGCGLSDLISRPAGLTRKRHACGHRGRYRNPRKLFVDSPGHKPTHSSNVELGEPPRPLRRRGRRQPFRITPPADDVRSRTHPLSRPLG
jgi:hypothetical protein